jgi:hypothetical protein
VTDDTTTKPRQREPRFTVERLRAEGSTILGEHTSLVAAALHEREPDEVFTVREAHKLVDKIRETPVEFEGGPVTDDDESEEG